MQSGAFSGISGKPELFYRESARMCDIYTDVDLPVMRRNSLVLSTVQGFDSSFFSYFKSCSSFSRSFDE